MTAPSTPQLTRYYWNGDENSPDLSTPSTDSDGEVAPTEVDPSKDKIATAYLEGASPGPFNLPPRPSISNADDQPLEKRPAKLPPHDKFPDTRADYGDQGVRDLVMTFNPEDLKLYDDKSLFGWRVQVSPTDKDFAHDKFLHEKIGRDTLLYRRHAFRGVAAPAYLLHRMSTETLGMGLDVLGGPPRVPAGLEEEFEKGMAEIGKVEEDQLAGDDGEKIGRDGVVDEKKTEEELGEKEATEEPVQHCATDNEAAKEDAEGEKGAKEYVQDSAVDEKAKEKDDVDYKEADKEYIKDCAPDKAAKNPGVAAPDVGEVTDQVQNKCPKEQVQDRVVNAKAELPAVVNPPVAKLKSLAQKEAPKEPALNHADNVTEKVPGAVHSAVAKLKGLIQFNQKEALKESAQDNAGSVTEKTSGAMQSDVGKPKGQDSKEAPKESIQNGAVEETAIEPGAAEPYAGASNSPDLFIMSLFSRYAVFPSKISPLPPPRPTQHRAQVYKNPFKRLQSESGITDEDSQAPPKKIQRKDSATDLASIFCSPGEDIFLEADLYDRGHVKGLLKRILGWHITMTGFLAEAESRNTTLQLNPAFPYTVSNPITSELVAVSLRFTGATRKYTGSARGGPPAELAFCCTDDNTKMWYGEMDTFPDSPEKLKGMRYVEMRTRNNQFWGRWCFLVVRGRVPSRETSPESSSANDADGDADGDSGRDSDNGAQDQPPFAILAWPSTMCTRSTSLTAPRDFSKGTDAALRGTTGNEVLPPPSIFGTPQERRYVRRDVFSFGMDSRVCPIFEFYAWEQRKEWREFVKSASTGTGEIVVWRVVE